MANQDINIVIRAVDKATKEIDKVS